MYKLNWSENEVEDLHDDFFMNIEDNFWEFINEEVDTAYYLGLHFDEWYNELNISDKKYLYSAGARHVNDDLEKYQSQLSFWQNKYKNDEDTIDLVNMSEYILNNMIFQPEDKDLIINLAFFLGSMTYKTVKLMSEEKEKEKEKTLPESEIFICECGNPQHQFILTSDPEFGPSMEICLNPERNIFKRIWIAIKYIFNCQPVNAFDEILFDPKDIDKICKMLKSTPTEATLSQETKED